MLHKKLYIQLKSDLCTASGFDYAGIIDQDVSIDTYGIPYISGRRIKGCLRQSYDAIKIIFDSVDSNLFGTIGNDKSGNLVVGNAYPIGYKELCSEIADQKKNKTIEKYATQENILSFYTSSKAQTALKDGVSKDNSLRFTRVINQYGIDGKEMVFEAKISFDEKYKDIMDKVVLATRNMGLKRNRGLGSVSLTLKDDEEKDSAEVKGKDNKFTRVCIEYTLKNVAPIIISSEDELVSTTYINGTSVLGLLAGRYLNKNNGVVDDTFKKLFMSKKTIYTNLYPFKDNNLYLPVPLYINELKKTKKLVNMISFDVEKHQNPNDKDNPYNTYGGNQAKKLKNKYIYESDNKFDVLEVSTEILYHNRHENKDVDKQLYYLEAIEAGQLFKGSIIVDQEYQDLILDLLQKEPLYFGKSKSAQYGKCTIQNIEVKEYQKLNCTNTGLVHVTLDSDAIFVDENNQYTVQFDEVRDSIAKSLGIENEGNNLSFVQTKIITGYSSAHNLRKPEICAIAAGSAFDFVLKEPISSLPYALGVKNQEGYGQYHIAQMNTFELEKVDEEATNPKNNFNAESSFGKMVYEIMKSYLLDELSSNLRDLKLNIGSASLGRLTLMLIESENESKEKCYEKLIERIKSIKSKSTQKEVTRFVNTLIKKENNFITIVQAKNTDTYKDINSIFGENKAKKCMDELWISYMKNVLLYRKYMK